MAGQGLLDHGGGGIIPGINSLPEIRAVDRGVRGSDGRPMAGLERLGGRGKLIPGAMAAPWQVGKDRGPGEHYSRNGCRAIRAVSGGTMANSTIEGWGAESRYCGCGRGLSKDKFSRNGKVASSGPCGWGLAARGWG